MRPGRVIAIVAVSAALLAAATVGAYLLLRTQGSPHQTAQRFLAAWQRGDLAAMRAELAAPAPAGFDAAYRAPGLGSRRITVSLTGVREDDTGATASFTAVHDLSAGRWSYTGSLRLTVKDRRWKVDWSPSAVHPDLSATTSLAVTTRWPRRAAVTAADGQRIDGTDVGGSVQQLVGHLDKATAKDVERLGGAPYRPGRPIGRGGLQAAFEKRLAGHPTTEIVLTGPGGKQIKTLGSLPGRPGEPVTTTLDLRVQQAAADTVRDVDKPASLVAIRPSTGEILAVANNRGGFNRALDGGYPPGSTFKTVTALALLTEGLSPRDRVTCPKFATVGGLRIRNSDHAAFGSLTFSDSFAHSCNTTFAPLAASRLGADKLVAAGESLGFNRPLNIGFPVRTASLPRPESDAELAAESFGQGRITASPLVMATVAAAVADGTWRPPTLVASPPRRENPVELDDEAIAALRTMMAAVVTKGTAKDAGLPPGTHGKTGTAEFGTGKKLNSHAWFIGYRGDVALAVVVEGGGGGGSVAAPLAARFLRALP